MTSRVIAFVSYNAFTGEGNGIVAPASGDHRALLLQNVDGRAWAAGVSADVQADSDLALASFLPFGPVPEDAIQVAESCRDNRGKAILDLVSAPEAEGITEVDHVVMYVGAGVPKQKPLMTLLAGRKPDEVTFVGCDCWLSGKRDMIAEAGLTESQFVDCDCGGEVAMAHAFRTFLDTGNLDFSRTH